MAPLNCHKTCHWKHFHSTITNPSFSLSLNNKWPSFHRPGFRHKWPFKAHFVILNIRICGFRHKSALRGKITFHDKSQQMLKFTTNTKTCIPRIHVFCLSYGSLTRTQQLTLTWYTVVSKQSKRSNPATQLTRGFSPEFPWLQSCASCRDRTQHRRLRRFHDRAGHDCLSHQRHTCTESHQHSIQLTIFYLCAFAILKQFIAWDVTISFSIWLLITELQRGWFGDKQARTNANILHWPHFR